MNYWYTIQCVLTPFLSYHQSSSKMEIVFCALSENTYLHFAFFCILCSKLVFLFIQIF